MNLEKLKVIFTLAKESKGKNFSELTFEEKSAVLIAGELRPAEMKNGKPVYSKDAKKTTLAPGYVDLNKVHKMYPVTEKKFMVNSFHVIMDEPYPHDKVKTVTWQQAVEDFPSYHIPDGKCQDYIDFPHLQRDAQKVEDWKNYQASVLDIAVQITKTTVKLSRQLNLTKEDLALIALVKERYSKIKKIGNALMLGDAVEYLYDHDEPGELPKGSFDIKELDHLETSAEALYIAMLSQGRFIRKDQL